MNKKINVLSNGLDKTNEEIITTIIKNRGIDDIDRFINPSFEDVIPLDRMKNVDKASQIVIDGMKNNKKFMIYFDVDCDGVSSGAIMTRYLRSFNIDAKTYINSFKIHGITEESLDFMNDIDILIVVDSLNSDISLYKKIKNKGIEIIVLDHHEVSKNVPYNDYVTLVSSNVDYENNELSGSGVTLKFCLYLDGIMGTSIADEYYDLAACGILADMMSVDQYHLENRYIVKCGLEKLNNPAIKKIIGSYTFNSTSVAYSIAPLINASMRFNKNEYAMNMLLEDENKEILRNLRVLKKCKEEQTNEVNNIIPYLISQVSKQIDNKFFILDIETENGISGLLATKILDMYGKPTIVVNEKDGEYVGSLRADGIDFRGICEETNCGEFNGHAMAAGVVIYKDKRDEFVSRVNSALNNVKFDNEIIVDMELDTNSIDDDLIDSIKVIDYISGQGFKPVKIMISTSDYNVTTMSNGKHLIFNTNDYSYFKFIKWNNGEKIDEYEDCEIMGDKLTFIGTLERGYLGRQYCKRMIVDNIILD